MKEDRPRDWWQTIPGILTGLAGITTATTGLVIALHQAGFFGGKVSTSGTSTSSAPSEDIANLNPPVSPPMSAQPSIYPSSSLEVQAVISDSEGFTNVRSEPEVQSNTIARVLEGESFYTIPQQGDWWPVRTKDNKLGYMHRSRIRVQN
ncbi:MAG: SH3 domain-containing protein [Leptolyngbyaceae cyanobacterium CSU_1_4]|nr:SH3 domain-containing protein [Leptolyngbyaceae cyanobacterium CSU_1_4]